MAHTASKGVRRGRHHRRPPLRKFDLAQWQAPHGSPCVQQLRLMCTSCLDSAMAAPDRWPALGVLLDALQRTPQATCSNS